MHEMLGRGQDTRRRGGQRMVKDIMIASEVAEYLNLSEAHVRRLTSTKEIPHIKIGHAVRYKKSDIESWLSAHAIRTRQEINHIATTYVATTSKRP